MSLKLTQTVQKGGCAAKVAAAELRAILSQVKFPPSPPELKIGADTFDDAAVFEIKKFSSGNFSLVQTLDFFTPIVDTPYLFGQIATANALSDVFAMGGRPLTAMGILAFPLATLDNSVAVQLLQGASDKLAEAQTPLVGGHSIDDDTLKFGLSVTGAVETSKAWSNAGAKAGDILILTKALGTGAITAALKRQAVVETQIEVALQSMAQLNDLGFLEPELRDSIHAATDITGFGIAGHALNMSRASQCTFELNISQLPLLPRLEEFIEKGFLTKAHRTNFEYTKDFSELSQISEVQSKIIFDPQTSGGLLLAVSPDKADILCEKIRTRFPKTQKVGRVQSFQKVNLQWMKN
ncbi:MAG: selenide, water dikinase SelD [Bdellovibrionales bacterium]